MDVLLTFTGFHDPYSQGLVGEEEQPGPVLTLVATEHFQKVVLFSTPRTKDISAQTAEAITLGYPSIEVETKEVTLSDPTDYRIIISSLRKHFEELRSENDQYYIGISSGTPQMHAVWIMLAASGEIPAHVLMTRSPKHVTKDAPLIKEVDLSSAEFPKIRSEFWSVEAAERVSRNLREAVKELGIVGDHSSMQDSLRVSAALAASDAPILITGETGTGKELFAHLIHLCSERARKAFVPVNCASLPEQLVESILFGHKKGAFTGATSDLVGKFEQADGGTLFLDELGELPLPTQAKLLRVVQDGIVEPLGSNRSKEINVRLVAATNRDLQREIDEGRFREDLFYRLETGVIQLPSLRERKSDIPKIALSVLDGVNSKLKKRKRLSQAALIRLQNHNWPGNIRDLQNVIERSILLSQSDLLEPEDLIIRSDKKRRDSFTALPEPQEGFSLDEYLSLARKNLILRALDIAQGNQSEAGRLLGISPQAVNKFLKERRS